MCTGHHEVIICRQKGLSLPDLIGAAATAQMAIPVLEDEMKRTGQKGRQTAVEAVALAKELLNA